MILNKLVPLAIGEFLYLLVLVQTGTYQYVPVRSNLPVYVQVYRIPDDFYRFQTRMQEIQFCPAVPRWHCQCFAHKVYQLRDSIRQTFVQKVFLQLLSHGPGYRDAQTRKSWLRLGLRP